MAGECPENALAKTAQLTPEVKGNSLATQDTRTEPVVLSELGISATNSFLIRHHQAAEVRHRSRFRTG